jgi:hypothetical protein
MFDFMYISAEELLAGAKLSYAFLEANHERLGIPNPALTLKAPLDEFDAALSAARDTAMGNEPLAMKDFRRDMLIKEKWH